MYIHCCDSCFSVLRESVAPELDDIPVLRLAVCLAGENDTCPHTEVVCKPAEAHLATCFLVPWASWLEVLHPQRGTKFKPRKH